MTTDLKDRNSELVAKRWANALLELVCEDVNLSKEGALADLRQISENIEASEDLKNAINNPSISVEEKQVILSKLFQDKIMPIVYNFVFVLNLKKRLNLIPSIADEFEKKLEEINKIAHVLVTSAIEIDDNKKNEIRDKLSQKLNKKVELTWGVDEDIIAGLIFNINETIIDNSVKNKLEKISKSIRG